MLASSVSIAEELPNCGQVKSDQHKFSIPVYPGMELYKREHAILNPPFATILRVYRTKSGAPYDKEKVLSFYSDYYKTRGWKPAIFKRRGAEPYLGLSIGVYAPGGKYASVQVSGELNLWLSPRDGMLTFYMHQWRNSALSTISRASFAQLESKIKAVTNQNGYDLQRAYTYSSWPEFYKNENLVDAKLFSLFEKRNKSRRHGGFNNSVTIMILAYKDPNSAKAHASKLLEKSDGLFIELENGDRFPIKSLDPSQKSVAQKKNILVLIKRNNKRHERVVRNLLEALRGNEMPDSEVTESDILQR